MATYIYCLQCLLWSILLPITSIQLLASSVNICAIKIWMMYFVHDKYAFLPEIYCGFFHLWLIILRHSKNGLFEIGIKEFATDGILRSKKRKRLSFASVAAKIYKRYSSVTTEYRAIENKLLFLLWISYCR